MAKTLTVSIVVPNSVTKKELEKFVYQLQDNLLDDGRDWLVIQEGVREAQSHEESRLNNLNINKN